MSTFVHNPYEVKENYEGMDPYHDNARCTKATLTTIGESNPLLSGMRVFDVPNTLNRDDMLAIYTNYRRETGVDGGMVELFRCWIDLGNYLDDIRRNSVSQSSTPH